MMSSGHLPSVTNPVYNTVRVLQWQKNVCDIHKPSLNQACACKLPYSLHQFPLRAQDQVRITWLNNVNGKDCVPNTNIKGLVTSVYAQPKERRLAPKTVNALKVNSCSAEEDLHHLDNVLPQKCDVSFPWPHLQDHTYFCQQSTKNGATQKDPAPSFPAYDLDDNDKYVGEKHLTQSQKPASPFIKEAETSQIKEEKDATKLALTFVPLKSEYEDKDVGEKHFTQCQKSASPFIKKPETPQIKEEEEDATKSALTFVPSKSEDDNKDVGEKHLTQCQKPMSPFIKEAETPQIKEDGFKLAKMSVPSKSEDDDKDIELPEFAHMKEEEEQFPYIKRAFSLNQEEKKTEIPHIKEEGEEKDITNLSLTCVPLNSENEDKGPSDENSEALPPSGPSDENSEALPPSGQSYENSEALPPSGPSDENSEALPPSGPSDENREALPPSKSTSHMKKGDGDCSGPSQSISDIEAAVRKLIQCIKDSQNHPFSGSDSQPPRQNSVHLKKQRALPGAFNRSCPPMKKKAPEPPSSKSARLRLFHFCLMSEYSATTPKDEAVLLRAGLGRRSIIISEDADHTEITTILHKEYPKLQDLRGGWLLQKAAGGSGQRKLTPVLQTSMGYTTKTLLSSTKNGKNVIYIVPIQEKMDTSPLPFDAPEFSHMPKNDCLTCGASVPLLMLPLHIESCH
ncbi:uncharacterized protein LOC130930324 [Corythoichthys intestinalis]|uniref:uncharacterized protein LOC130930324 n=1 Tax=Corythoichthys intestinalis TaxID=161448 RepID=UPI0025A52D86|nr:uncharacterized protein LOC130930324 [Corythoichthys intestinalis]